MRTQDFFSGQVFRLLFAYMLSTASTAEADCSQVGFPEGVVQYRKFLDEDTSYINLNATSPCNGNVTSVRFAFILPDVNIELPPISIAVFTPIFNTSNTVTLIRQSQPLALPINRGIRNTFFIGETRELISIEFRFEPNNYLRVSRGDVLSYEIGDIDIGDTARPISGFPLGENTRVPLVVREVQSSRGPLLERSVSQGPPPVMSATIEPEPLPPPEQNIITDQTDQNTATDLLVNTLLTAGARGEQDDVLVLISTLVPLGVLVVGAIMASVVIAVIVCKCKRKKSTRVPRMSTRTQIEGASQDKHLKDPWVDIYATLCNEPLYDKVFTAVDVDLYREIMSARQEWNEYDDIYCCQDTAIEMYVDVLPNTGQSPASDNRTNGQYDIVYRRSNSVYANTFDYVDPFPMYANSADLQTNVVYEQIKYTSPHSISRNSVKIYNILGQGNFGCVYKGEWRQGNGSEVRDVAVKQLEKNMKEGTAKFLREFLIVSQCKHKNVIEVYATISDSDPKLIVMELCSKGDLKHYLRYLTPQRIDSEPQQLPLLLLKFARDIAAGMSYISSQGIIHCDLAARNVLVTDFDICKISDFGMSLHMNSERIHQKERLGAIPLKWTSPEAILFGTYSESSDVWSYGVVLFELWSLGKTPYHTLDNKTVVMGVSLGQRLPPPPGCPRALYTLMMDTWNTKALKRPRFADIETRLSAEPRELLYWDTTTPPSAGVIGGQLIDGMELYTELSQRYVKEHQRHLLQ